MVANLLVFDTPSGRYRFKRLPYGIHSAASEIFQREFTSLFRTYHAVQIPKTTSWYGENFTGTSRPLEESFHKDKRVVLS